MFLDESAVRYLHFFSINIHFICNLTTYNMFSINLSNDKENEYVPFKFVLKTKKIHVIFM